MTSQVNGFTAWINFRLHPYGSNLTNFFNEIFSGFVVQQLLHS